VKKSEWSDRELEELLRQMPKIRDHRDPRDIYQNISLRKRKTLSWFLPGIAAAVALFLFFILVPKLIVGTPFSQNHAGGEKSSAAEAPKDNGNTKDFSAVINTENASSLNYAKGRKSAELKGNSLKTAIYDNEVGKGMVLTYWIPDQQGQILIPVSTIVRKTQGKSWLALFIEKMASLKEDEWGLSNFYPLNATLKLDANHHNVCVDVPSNHQYGQGSDNETSFIHVLEKDIASNSNLKKIKLSTNGTPGIEFGNFGKLEELNIQMDKGHGIFFYYSKHSNIPFLVPSIDKFKDIKAAILAMRNDQPVYGLKRSLSSLTISEVGILDKTLYLTMDGNTNLQNDPLTLSSFEAILLTAKEFGLDKVIVKGSPFSHIGSFDLSKEIKVPLAPNFRNF
jgi:hypothetical protein